eukprot:scaffold26055_cov57-Phaeocystis_antarctica.AAC.3
MTSSRCCAADGASSLRQSDVRCRCRSAGLPSAGLATTTAQPSSCARRMQSNIAPCRVDSLMHRLRPHTAAAPPGAMPATSSSTGPVCALRPGLAQTVTPSGSAWFGSGLGL